MKRKTEGLILFFAMAIFVLAVPAIAQKDETPSIENTTWERADQRGIGYVFEKGGIFKLTFKLDGELIDSTEGQGRYTQKGTSVSFTYPQTDTIVIKGECNLTGPASMKCLMKGVNTIEIVLNKIS